MRCLWFTASPTCITRFIVEKGMQGSPAQKLDKLGMRGSNTCELYQGLRRSRRKYSGKPHQGVAVLMSAWIRARVLAAGRSDHGRLPRRRDAYVHGASSSGSRSGVQLMQEKSQTVHQFRLSRMSTR